MTKVSSASQSSAAAALGLLLLFPATQSIAVAQIAGAASGASLSVTSGRPLAEMLDRIEHLYVLPIDFEEAPYESSLDLKTIPVVQNNGFTKTFLALPITTFNVTLEPQSSLYAATQSVLSSYAAANLPGVYTIVQSGDRLSVVPQQIHASGGGSRSVTPVMGTPVSFPLATRSVADTLELVVQSIVSATGAKVLLLDAPFFITDTVTIGATGQPAREVIASLGNAFNRAIATQCLFDASDRTYYLNVRSVYAPNPAGVPAVASPRLPVPAVGPPNTKWFTKP